MEHVEVKKMDMPLIVFVIVSIFMFINYFIVIPGGPALSGWLSNAVISIGNWALIYGFLNLLRVHGPAIIEMRKREWYHSVLTLGTAALMFYASIPGANPIIYTWLWDNIWYGLMTALMCYVGFFNFSGLYRTFRVRNWDGVWLIVACLFGMVINAPILIVAWKPLASIASWIADSPSMGAWLGFHLVTGLGMYGLATRALLGLERSMLGTSAGEVE